MAVLLTPVCAEMRGYDSDSSNLSCKHTQDQFRIICQYRLSCIHLKCPFTAKMDISIGNRKGEAKDGLNEALTLMPLRQLKNRSPPCLTHFPVTSWNICANSPDAEPVPGIMGKSGAGKSSLCNALFQGEVTPVSDVHAGTREVQRLSEWSRSQHGYH